MIALDVALLVLCVVFAADYVARLALAKPQARWFWRNIPLLLMVVLPFFRPLYLLRLMTLLAVLRKATGSAFRGTVTVYVTVSALVIILIGALGVLDAEQNADGALITTFPDALWWALGTITTVGYGDLYPVTGTGRIIASGLMIAGIALVGSVTAALASWFVERIKDVDERAVREATTGGSDSVGDGGEGGEQTRERRHTLRAQVLVAVHRVDDRRGGRANAEIGRLFLVGGDVALDDLECGHESLRLGDDLARAMAGVAER